VLIKALRDERELWVGECQLQHVALIGLRRNILATKCDSGGKGQGEKLIDSNFAYDALDRLIGRQTFQFDTGDAPVSTTSYAYDGSTRILEANLQDGGSISRTYVTGTGGEVLAIEQTVSSNTPSRKARNVR